MQRIGQVVFFAAVCLSWASVPSFASYCNGASYTWQNTGNLCAPSCYSITQGGPVSGHTLASCELYCEANNATCCGFYESAGQCYAARGSGFGTSPSAGWRCTDCGTTPPPPTVCSTSQATWQTTGYQCAGSCASYGYTGPFTGYTLGTCITLCQSQGAACCGYYDPTASCYVGYGNSTAQSTTAAPGARCSYCATNYSPGGWLDAGNCSQISGWTCDQNDYSAPVTVHIYDSNTLVTTVVANGAREAAVGAACGGYSNHGFSLATPAAFQNGATHTMRVYAQNIPSGGLTEIPNSPQTVTCRANCGSCSGSGECISGNCSSSQCAPSGVTVGAACGCAGMGATYDCSGECVGGGTLLGNCQTCTQNCQCQSNNCSAGICAPTSGNLQPACTAVTCAAECQSGTMSGGVCSPCPNAAYVAQTVPGTVVAGSTTSVSVTMQNTGSVTWQDPLTCGSVNCSYRLGSQNPQDNSIWGLSRVGVAGITAPGASKVFSFNITAPTTPGPRNFQWRMLQEGVTWFGATTPNASINVVLPYCSTGCSSSSDCVSPAYCVAGQCVHPNYNTGCTSAANNCGWTTTGNYQCDGSTCDAVAPSDCAGAPASCCGTTCCNPPGTCCGTTCCPAGYGCSGGSCAIVLPYSCTP